MCAPKKLTEAMQKLGMKEGFDVALEMSGNPKAFADILPNMFHGGKIALLGIMPGSAAIDWNTVVFSALTIKGVYGREMYETWYKMTAMIQSGLDISPVITHRFPYTEFKEAIELMKSGNSGKDGAQLGRIVTEGATTGHRGLFSDPAENTTMADFRDRLYRDSFF